MSNELIRQAISLLQQAIGSDNSAERGPLVDADGVYRPAWLDDVRKAVFAKYPSGYLTNEAPRIDPRTGLPAAALSEKIVIPTGFYWDKAPGLTDQQLESIRQNHAVSQFLMIGTPYPFGVTCHWYDVVSSLGGLMKSRVRGKELTGVLFVNTPSNPYLSTEDALETDFKAYISGRYNIDL